MTVNGFAIKVDWMPERIYIATTTPPEEMFKDRFDVISRTMVENGDIKQLLSRITFVSHYTGANRRINTANGLRNAIAT